MGLRHVFKDINNFFAVGKLRHRLKTDRFRFQLEQETVRCTERGVTDERYCDHEVIVSLTTYDKRLPIAYLTIASLMRQTLKPNRIILWLADSFREGGVRLPATLTLLQKRGLEIRFCDEIRSYKKLIPAIEAFPDAIIITVDDDVMYDITLIDRLVSAHLSEPDVVWATRASKITLDENGMIKPYKKWTKAVPYEDSPLNVAVGVGGVLYPPHIFLDTMLDRKKFMELAPTADDLWFKAMEIDANINVKRTMPLNDKSEDYTSLLMGDADSLFNENVANGRNDKTISNLSQYFDRLTK